MSTDIQTAIAQLREAIGRGDGWQVIEPLYKALDSAMVGHFGEQHPLVVLQKVRRAVYPHVYVNRLSAALTALESAVTGDDLTSRIQAAAEEIADVQCRNHTVSILPTEIAAIIKRHVEGRKA